MMQSDIPNEGLETEAPNGWNCQSARYLITGVRAVGKAVNGKSDWNSSYIDACFSACMLHPIPVSPVNQSQSRVVSKEGDNSNDHEESDNDSDNLGLDIDCDQS